MKLFKDVNGNIVFTGKYNSDYFVARLDANGTGCAFTNTSVISSTNANTVLTDISFTTTAFTPVTVNETPVYSALAIGETMLCGGVGIEEEAQDLELHVYPNPGKNKITLQNLKFTMGTTIEISFYNTLGELAMTVRNQEEIDVQMLLPGIYFISAFNGEKIFRSKFIKE